MSSEEYSPLEFLGALVLRSGLEECDPDCPAPYYQRLLEAANDELSSLPGLDSEQHFFWREIGRPTFYVEQKL